MEETPAAEETTEEPAAEESVVEEAPVVEEDLSEIVASLSEADVVLVDEVGEVIPLASEEAAEMLTAPDPYIVRGGTTYQFVTDCTPFGGPSATCDESANPIQAALDFAIAGEIIVIEAGTAPEDIHVSTNNLTLQRDTVDINMTSITLNALNLSTNGILTNLVFVTDNGSIQNGIDIVTDGGTVNVGAGTYTEQVKINKSVSVKGAGKDVTNIIPDPTYTHCRGPQCGPEDRALVDIDGGNESATASTINVLLDGFTVDGEYVYGNKFGVFVHGGAYAEISNNTVMNFYDDDYPGGNQINILAGYLGQDWPWSGSAGYWDYTGHAYVHDNYVTGFNTVGMMVWGPDSTGTFDNNVIDPDPNDFHLSAGAMGIVL